MSILPLMLLWLWSLRGGGGGSGAKPPPWPTPSSPPPMPAFAPGPAPAHDANTGTPLANLHAAAPQPKATAAHPSSHIPKHAHVVTPKKPEPAAAKAAHAAVKKAAASIPAIPHPATGATMRPTTVADIQAILINRGSKISHDGLYGPKTAKAWAALARKKGLPPEISRVDAKIARVAAQTYDALAVPAIP